MQQQKNTNLFLSNSNKNRLFFSKIKLKLPLCIPSLSSGTPLHPRSHLPTLPSLWSVLGSAMMAWTATMASLILVWSSLSSSMCSRRRIWAASFRVASERRGQSEHLFYLVKKSKQTLLHQCAIPVMWDFLKSSIHLQYRNPRCACLKLLEHPGTKEENIYNREHMKTTESKTSPDLNHCKTTAVLPVETSSAYLSVLAGFSDGFWRESVLDENTNCLAGTESTVQSINCLRHTIYRNVKIKEQISYMHKSHLEHNQVVVMPLDLEDVRQGCHSRFEIGRVTWKNTKRVIIASFVWNEQIKKKRVMREGEEAKRKDGQRNVSTHCQGWREGLLLCHCC